MCIYCAFRKSMIRYYLELVPAVSDSSMLLEALLEVLFEVLFEVRSDALLLVLFEVRLVV